MQNLLLFLIRYRSFLLFGFLELFSLFLVVKFNNRQNEIFFSSSSFFAGTFYSQRDKMTKYINLSEVADQLSAENAKLRSQPIVLVDTMQIDSGLIVDSASFIFRPAKVINSSVKKSKNSLTINKGLKDGIQPRMGVLSDDGVVGIVRNASKNFSVVIPLINIQSSISCKVKGKGYFGSLKWQGLDIRDFELKDIPKYAKLERGDTLITSGFSYIFPEGYKVGVVDTFWTIPGNDFYRTKVTVFTDFSKLDYVYALENVHGAELDSLQNAANE